MQKKSGNRNGVLFGCDEEKKFFFWSQPETAPVHEGASAPSWAEGDHMKAYALLLGLFFVACTEPRVCGQCNGEERACFDTRAEAELACPGGFTPHSDSGSIDGSILTDTDTPDAGNNDIGVNEDARSPDATEDASRSDARPGDRGVEDAETPDAAHDDATPVDGGMADGTPDDLGIPDAEVPDAADPCPNPGPEVCNGRDDDCDGRIDEDFNNVLSLPCSVGIGACVRIGIGICDQDGGTTCSVTPHLPAAEICDNVDNDCDGMVDEDNPGAGEACDSGLLGMCGEGRTSCEAGELVCNAQHEPAAEEVCNDGRDNDCDGDTDEGCLCVQLQVYPCYQGPAGTAGVGQCREGTATCDALGMSLGACEGEIRPTQEVCNGLDDDCDGVVDDVLGVNDQCSLGQGICQAQGRWECGAEGLVCNAQPGNPAEEVCNGLDDDCDGDTDEDQPGGNEASVCDLDGCATGAGRETCDGGCQCLHFVGACREILYGSSRDVTEFTYELTPNGLRKDESRRYLGDAQRLVEIGTYVYGPDGRLVEIQVNRPDDNLDYRLVARHDAQDRLVGFNNVRDEGQELIRVITFTYEGGRIVRETEQQPDGIRVGVLSYSYDTADNLFRRTLTDPPGRNIYYESDYEGCDNFAP